MNTVHRSPRALRLLAAVGGILLVLPVLAMVWRIPWSAVGEVFSQRSTHQALALSVRTSVLATTLGFFVGLPLAWVLAFEEFPGKRVLRALCVLPMVLPPVVGGVILLFVLGRRGMVGAPLYDVFGWQFAFTEKAAVVAQFFVAAPFFIVVMESAFQQVDPRLVGVARSLGAHPWYVLRHVTLPVVRPSVIAGLVLMWARALGEFGATITFAGNTPGRTQTLPLAIYTSLEGDGDASLIMSLLLILVSFTVLVSMRARWMTAVFHRGGS